MPRLRLIFAATTAGNQPASRQRSTCENTGSGQVCFSSNSPICAFLQATCFNKLAQTKGSSAGCQSQPNQGNSGQVSALLPPSTSLHSLTVSSTWTPTAAMPSAFYWPLLVPYAPCGAPAPVNSVVRSRLKIRSGNSVQRLCQMSTSVQVHTSSTRESFVVPSFFFFA